MEVVTTILLCSIVGILAFLLAGWVAFLALAQFQLMAFVLALKGYDGVAAILSRLGNFASVALGGIAFSWLLWRGCHHTLHLLSLWHGYFLERGW